MVGHEDGAGPRQRGDVEGGPERQEPQDEGGEGEEDQGQYRIHHGRQGPKIVVPMRLYYT